MRLRFHAFTGTGRFGGQQVLFMRPQTYMNLSGQAVSALRARRASGEIIY